MTRSTGLGRLRHRNDDICPLGSSAWHDDAVPPNECAARRPLAAWVFPARAPRRTTARTSRFACLTRRSASEAIRKHDDRANEFNSGIAFGGILAAALGEVHFRDRTVSAARRVENVKCPVIPEAAANGTAFQRITPVPHNPLGLVFEDLRQDVFERVQRGREGKEKK